jgi:type II restriction enzyme
MATSAQLRANKEQHKPKNRQSKGDDKKVAEAMNRVKAYVDEQFNLAELGFSIDYVKSIKLSELMGIIRSYEQRSEFAPLTSDSASIRPDGGILILRKVDDKSYKRIVLAVEMKRQGTNDQRVLEGKKEQSRGNAIERLGKNLIGIRATLHYEPITPFVCFGWGDDFAPPSSILDRVITLNEFYPLNKTLVHKRDKYAPVSMYFRKKEWEVEELFKIMKDIAETSIRQYIH